MLIFIDTANIDVIKKWSHFVDGVTTNPTLIAKEIARTGKDFQEIIKTICSEIKGPVNAEVTSNTFESMLSEGLSLADIDDNVCVKLPLTHEGLKVAKILHENDVMCNITLCFSLNQAIAAFNVKPKFISPFVGRLDDIGEDGTILVEEMVKIKRQIDSCSTSILAASIRSLDHIKKVALLGADIATLSADLIEKMIKHQLTDIGIEKFKKDWEFMQ